MQHLIRYKSVLHLLKVQEMTDEEKEKEEVVDAQKLSARDKKEISEGACVNCAVFMFILTVFMLMTLIL